MTAPNVMSTPAGPQRALFQRKRTGATGSSGGDGGYDANGVMRQPGTAQPGDATAPGGANAGATHSWNNTSHPPAPQQQSGQNAPAVGGGQQPQTFAQMSASGQARPAPPQQQTMQGQQQQQQASPVAGQLQNAVSSALQTPSRYDLPQVQQVQSALTSQLQQQFGAQQKQLDEQMASRGLGASSIGAGYQGDLAGQQSTALANMNAQLIQNFAATQAGDQSAALGAGQANVNAANQQQLGLGNLGVAQQQANTTQQGTLGNLALGQGQLTGQLNGQSTLGAQQLAQSGSQFQQNLGLQQQLGLGNLGVQQQQANTAQTSALGNLALGQGQLGLAQGEAVGDIGGQSTLGAQSLGLQQQLGLGNLGVAQQQANTQQAGTMGNLALGQGQLGVQQNAQSIQQQQFQQSFAQNASQFGQTYALQQAQQDLNQQVQTGQLSIAQANQQLAQLQNTQQNTLATNAQSNQASQFAQQLAQSLQQSTTADATQNRAIDVQGQTSGTNMLMQLLQILGPNTDWSTLLGKLPGTVTGGGAGAGTTPVGAGSTTDNGQSTKA